MRTKKNFHKYNEVINRLHKNHIAESETLCISRKELEKVCNPIITKLYWDTEACQKNISVLPWDEDLSSRLASSGSIMEDIDQANKNIETIALQEKKKNKKKNKKPTFVAISMM